MLGKRRPFLDEALEVLAVGPWLAEDARVAVVFIGALHSRPREVHHAKRDRLLVAGGLCTAQFDLLLLAGLRRLVVKRKRQLRNGMPHWRLRQR